MRDEAQKGADASFHQGGDYRADGERHEYLQETLHKDVAIHSQNAADDDARDKQVQKVRVFREFNDGFFDLGRQQLVVSEGRRNESRENRSGADVAIFATFIPSALAYYKLRSEEH